MVWSTLIKRGKLSIHPNLSLGSQIQVCVVSCLRDPTNCRFEMTVMINELLEISASAITVMSYVPTLDLTLMYVCQVHMSCQQHQNNEISES